MKNSPALVVSDFPPPLPTFRYVDGEESFRRLLLELGGGRWREVEGSRESYCSVTGGRRNREGLCSVFEEG